MEETIKYEMRIEGLEVENESLLEACKKTVKYLSKLKEMGRLHADGIIGLDSLTEAIQKAE